MSEAAVSDPPESEVQESAVTKRELPVKTAATFDVVRLDSWLAILGEAQSIVGVVGDLIKATRSATSTTQADLATASLVTLSRIGSIEAGKSLPTLDEAHALVGWVAKIAAARG